MRTIGYTEFVALTREVNTGGIIKLCNIVNLYGAPNNAYGFDNARIVCCGGKFVNIPPQGVTASTITISFGNTTLEGDTNGIFDCTAGGNIKVEGGVNGRTYELRWWKLTGNVIFEDFFDNSLGYATYVFDKNYSLGGRTVTFGADGGNCTLRFENNSRLTNGTVTGNMTGIQAPMTHIFGADLTFAGTWRVDEFYAEWYGAVGNGTSQDANSILRCLNAFKKVTLINTYLIEQNTELPQDSILVFKGGKLTASSGITLTCNNAILLSMKPLADTLENVTLYGAYQLGWMLEEPTPQVGE